MKSQLDAVMGGLFWIGVILGLSQMGRMLYAFYISGTWRLP